MIKRGSIHEDYLDSRAKIQIMGGGYANGKTAATCIKCIGLAKDYPGSNGLIGRATFPKLNDTIRREFFHWLPKDWIKSYSKSENTLELVNGSIVNFRYVQQRASAETSATSNLLSATYDWIAVDQMDDPEFRYKDYVDLIGRLRGSTQYKGTDPSMPPTGPRWFMITLNPTRNWIYKRVIRPVLEYDQSGILVGELKDMIDAYGTEKVNDVIQVVTGSTYENIHNLEADYVRLLEATYHGTMRDRFLMGGWQAYSGLVYPMYDDAVHMVDEKDIKWWIREQRPTRVIEGFDWGLASPSAYLLFIVDQLSNVVCVDGFKQKELLPEDVVRRIKDIRDFWNLPTSYTGPIYADPSIFKRTGGSFRTVGKSVADVYNDSGRGISMTRGNNDVVSGLTKVSVYLNPHSGHKNPFTGQSPAPHLYFNRDRLDFLDDEIVDYYYEKADGGEDELEDKPVDRNDHAMDALKYALTGTPEARLLTNTKPDYSWMRQWHVRQQHSDTRRASGRYGSIGSGL